MFSVVFFSCFSFYVAFYDFLFAISTYFEDPARHVLTTQMTQRKMLMMFFVLYFIINCSFYTRELASL